MSRFAPNAKSCFAMRMPGWTAALLGEKESMQAMQRTLLQTCHAGTDETSNAFLRSRMLIYAPWEAIRHLFG